MTLTKETFTGIWAGLPVGWTADDQFDEKIYRGDVARCCRIGAAGVYTGGTSGEFYAMEFDEFQAVARATVEECHANETPSMIGCTSTCTRSAVRRAEFAARIGADAVQVALPFWMTVDDKEVVGFFKEVADAAGDAALSVYETNRAKKVLTFDQHRAIKDAISSYLMVKANEGPGCTPEGCKAMSEFVNVFVSEELLTKLGRAGAMGSCSSLIYYNPRLMLRLWSNVVNQRWDEAERDCHDIGRLFDFFNRHFAQRGFEDAAFDKMGGVAGGFLKTSLKGRGPYPSATEHDVEALRSWYSQHWPEMLNCGEQYDQPHCVVTTRRPVRHRKPATSAP